MGGVDAARGGVEEGRRVADVGGDVVGGGEQPEEPVDEAIGGEREVGEAEHAVAEIGRLASGIVASLDERREHSVAGVEASAEQFLGDGEALALVAEVLDDAEQVPSVDAWGEGAYVALGLEDGDGLDDDVDGVARDGDAEVVFGVEEGEAPEGVVEESAHDRVLAGECGQPGAILLLAALLKGGARSIDLLGGDGLVVELDAGAATAIVAGSVVERTRPGLGDQREDLPGQLARLLPTEVEVGDRLLKESEAALHMSFGPSCRMHPMRAVRRNVFG